MAEQMIAEDYARIMEKAAEVLKGNWVKYNALLYMNEGGDKVGCGINWVSRVADQHGVEDISMRKVYSLMGDIAAEQFPDRTDKALGFTVFNDNEDTTEDDVLMVMEKARIQILEKGI